MRLRDAVMFVERVKLFCAINETMLVFIVNISFPQLFALADGGRLATAPLKLAELKLADTLSDRENIYRFRPR